MGSDEKSGDDCAQLKVALVLISSELVKTKNNVNKLLLLLCVMYKYAQRDLATNKNAGDRDSASKEQGDINRRLVQDIKLENAQLHRNTIAKENEMSNRIGTVQQESKYQEIFKMERKKVATLKDENDKLQAENTTLLQERSATKNELKVCRENLAKAVEMTRVLQDQLCMTKLPTKGTLKKYAPGG